MTSAPKKKAPVRLSGNSGTRYENEVAARFLLDILAGTNSLGSDFGMILRIDWQSRDLGWFGDDLAINCRDLAGETRSIGISIKSNQQVTNKGFPNDFVELAWAQWLEVPTARPFRRGKDAIGLVLAEISPPIFSDWSALLKEILSTTPDRIVSRLAATKPSGSQSSDMQRLLVQSFACPDHYKEDRPPEEVIKLLHDIRVLPLDFTHPTSQSKVAALSDCQKLLSSGSSIDARNLWERLVGIADEKRPAGGSLDLAGLLAALRGQFKLTQHPDFAHDWETLSNITSDYKARIETELPSGYSVSRNEEAAKLQVAISASTLTVVFGDSGTGKSSLVKTVLDQQFAEHKQVWLGPDELKIALSAARRGTLPLQHALGDVLNASNSPQNLLVLDSAERIGPAELKATKLLMQSLLGPAPQSEDPTWRIIVIIQSWAGAEEMLGGRQAQLVEIEPLTSTQVKRALLADSSLGWLIGHDDTIALLTNLRTLAWVVGAGSALSSNPSGLTSHTAIADRLWVYWTNDSSDLQSLMMRLSEREGSFERSFSLTGLDPSDSATFARRPPQLPLRLNRGTNRIEFEHDLAADWARFQFLKQIAHKTAQWASFAGNPLWTNALRMLGQLLLRDPLKGATAWDDAFAATEAQKLRPANDILLDAICLDPEAERHLSERADLLLADDAKRLARLLTRFHHIGTVPTSGSWGADSSLGLYLEVQNRSVIVGRWIPILRFLISQRQRIGGVMLSATALIWLKGTPKKFSNGTPFVFRRELAEIALAVARSVQVEKAKNILYGTEEQELYTAPLAGAADLPDEVAIWALEMAGRRKIAPDIEAKIAEDRRLKAEAHAQRLQTDPAYRDQHAERREMPSFVGFGREKLPPWPLGASLPVDPDFRKVGLTANGLTTLMQAAPNVAAEVLLALIIEDEPYREYDSSRFEVELGLDYAHEGYPTAFWKSPFFSFLQIAPQIALKSIIALVNFCTERWAAEVTRNGGRLMPSITLQYVDGKSKAFSGGPRVFSWTQENSNHNGNLFCALDALERWMTLQITTGADITQYIDQILQEASSAAFLGLLANVGKFQPSLFSSALAPLLSDPHLIYWDSRRVENVGSNFIAWSWAQAGEVIFELAKNWVLAPHRKRALLDVAVELLKTDDSVAQRLKALIPTWKLPDAPKEALEFKLIFAELDRDNYKQTVDEESGTNAVLKLTYPEALLREAQEWQEKSAKPLRYILLPSEIEKLLQEGKPIDDDSASRLFELMQSCKADSEIELHAKLECEVALAAALVVCGDAWLSSSPEAKEITIAVIKDALLRIGTTYQEIRNERIGSPRNELKFAAHAAAHLWIKHQPKASEWESAVLRVLTSGNYPAAGAIFQIAYTNRHLLGSGWARLMQAATMWSGLIMLSVDNDTPKSAKQPWDFWLARLRRFSLQRDSPSADGLKLTRIAKGCERIDYAQRLRAYNSGAIRWREKPKRRRGMELDTHFLAVAFSWLTKGDATGSWADDTRLVNELWIYEVSRAKARAKREDREYDLPSNPLGYELLAKLAALSLAAPPDQARAVWSSVLSHGPSAHYAVQQFIRSFFQLAKIHDPDRFEAVWREMIEYGLSANWNKLYGVWFYGVRIICDMLGFGSERVLLSLSPGAALRMQDIYERWAIAHLGDDEECVSRFCYFLTSEFAAPLRLDGLRWISQTLKVSGRSDRWYRERTTDALIELLNVSVSQDASELASSIDARQALVELTANLADRGLSTALALQERIKLLR